MKKFVITAACAALGLAMVIGSTGCSAAPAGSAHAAGSEEEITVSASSSVHLTPDKATVSFGVSTQDATAEKAQSKNSEAVNKVIAVLTDRGIDEKSIRTTNYSMYPQYNWSETGEERIIGYNVTTSLSVQDQNIEDLGKLLSACVAAGVNRVDNVSFLCSGYDEAYHQALSQAVAASRDKAEALASAAGRKLGEAVSITEGWQDTSARYGQPAAFAVEDMAMNAAEPVFQPGETEISANVTVTYKMQ